MPSVLRRLPRLECWAVEGGRSAVKGDQEPDQAGT